MGGFGATSVAVLALFLSISWFYCSSFAPWWQHFVLETEPLPYKCLKSPIVWERVNERETASNFPPQDHVTFPGRWRHGRVNESSHFAGRSTLKVMSISQKALEIITRLHTYLPSVFNKPYFTRPLNLLVCSFRENNNRHVLRSCHFLPLQMHLRATNKI